MTELEQRKTPDVHVDLASDNIADDNLTVNPSEAGLSSDEDDTEGSDSVTSDGALPLIPRGRNRVQPIVKRHRDPVAQRSPEACTSQEPPTKAPTTRKRLSKNTRVAEHQVAIEQRTDDLDTLLAGAPGGKLVVSRDSYHDLPPNVRGAFKRGDPRIVVVEGEGDAWSATEGAHSVGSLNRRRHQSVGATSSSAR